MKAQVSMEYILLALLTLLLVVPTAYFMMNSSKGSEAQVRDAQIQRIGNDIISNAEKLYYQGAPSRLSLKEQLPDGVTEISIVPDPAHKNFELIFKTNFSSGRLTIAL